MVRAEAAGLDQVDPVPWAEAHPSARVTTPAFLRARRAVAWAEKSSKSYKKEDAWMGEGITIQWEKWAVADGLRGFHERMPKRLDSQYVEHRTQECKRGLECGEYSLPPTQDAKELVRLGYMISPIFFVDKAERKTVRKAGLQGLVQGTRKLVGYSYL